MCCLEVAFASSLHERGFVTRAGSVWYFFVDVGFGMTVGGFQASVFIFS